MDLMKFKYLNLILSTIHNLNKNNKLIIENFLITYSKLLVWCFQYKPLFVAIKGIKFLPQTLIF